MASWGVTSDGRGQDVVLWYRACEVHEWPCVIHARWEYHRVEMATLLLVPKPLNNFVWSIWVVNIEAFSRDSRLCFVWTNIRNDIYWRMFYYYSPGIISILIKKKSVDSGSTLKLTISSIECLSVPGQRLVCQMWAGKRSRPVRSTLSYFSPWNKFGIRPSP